MNQDRILEFVLAVESHLDQVEAELRELRGLMAEIDAQRIDVPVNLDGAAETVAELKTVDAEADGLDGRTITMYLKAARDFLIANRLLNSLSKNLDAAASRYRTFAVLAAPAGLFALLAALSPLVAALTVGGAAAGGAAGGLGLLALSAVALKKAIEDGNPAALEFQRNWLSLRDTFYNEFIRNSGAVTNLALLGSNLMSVARTAMPALAAAAAATATAVDASLTRVLGELDNAAQRASFARILEGVPRLSGSAASAVGRLGGALANVFALAMPLAEDFLSYLDGLALKFLRFTQSAAGQQQIRDWLAQAVPAAQGLAAAIAGLARGMIALGAAGGAELVRNLGIAIGNIGESLPSLSILFRMLNTMLRAFNALPQPVQTLIIQAAALNLAFRILGLGGLVNVIGALGRLGPKITAVKTAMAGLSLGPLLALAALGAIVLTIALTFDWSAAKSAYSRARGEGDNVAIAFMKAVNAGIRTVPILGDIAKFFGGTTSSGAKFNAWLFRNVTRPLLDVTSGRAFKNSKGLSGFVQSVRQQLRLIPPSVRATGALVAAAFSGNWRGAVEHGKRLFSGLPPGARSRLRPMGPILRGVGGVMSSVMRGNWGQAIQRGQALFQQLPPGVRRRLQPIGGILRGAGAVVRGVFTGNWRAAIAGGAKLWDSLPPGVRARISRVAPVLRSAGRLAGQIMRGDYSGAVRTTLNILDTVAPGARSRLARVAPVLRSAGALAKAIFRGDWSAVVRIAFSILQTLAPGVASRLSQAANTVRSWGGQLRQLGVSAVQGLIQGALSMGSQLVAAFQSLAMRALQAAKDVIRPGSPSRAAFEIGVTVPPGLARGLLSGIPRVQAAARRMALAAMPDMPDVAGPRLALGGFSPGGAMGFGGPRAQVYLVRQEARSEIHVYVHAAPGVDTSRLDNDTITDGVARQVKKGRRRGQR